MLALILFLGLIQSTDIAIVVHPNVQVDNITFADLRKLLLGERQFWDKGGGLRVTLLMRAPAAREREVLLQKIYKMSEAQFKQYWVGKIFRAEAAAGPKIVYSNEMATELVTALPGSIAFVEASQVKNMKVLKIDGLLPGQKGYPLN